MTTTTLIVFSHLRWNFVYQRPQQLLSRLASERPVVFIEEPMGEAEQPWLEQSAPCPGVQVLRPHVIGPARGFHPDHLEVVQELLGQYLRDHAIEHCLLWLYTPLALPFASQLRPRGIVYDCMDELSAFRHSPPALIQREKELFQVADVVFTGGPSLYEAKRKRHAEVHCFPSSVDSAHFGQVATCQDHPDQAGIAHPRLGYYGVIDERLDMDLIANLADAHADWQVVMVGPVVKIDQATLPLRPNIHWMGQRSYDELPQFLAGWDVCLMPFALNEATRFISPTKTLEYLAAGKPAVSTPIRDVAEGYADVVSIAATPTEFVRACERILGRSATAQRAFERAAAKTIAATSWDRTVSAMAALLDRFDCASASKPVAASKVAAPGKKPSAAAAALPAAAGR
ncbi:MAG: glycosyltransferase family 1 protein [Rubrivivax sp.]|nr:MAG: glycosyltransferase family 1 protein [Rubrivivax sp.]